MVKESVLELPDEVTTVTKNVWPRDLLLVSLPKMGKSTILGDFTTKRNALVLDLEKGGYEYVNARKLTTYVTQDTTRYESYQNYIRYRKLLMENKGKYEFLIIDGMSDLDDLSEIGGTLSFMDSILGKKFNRDKEGGKLDYSDPDWKSVLTLPEGAGYRWTRDWLLQQIEFFRIISPHRIYGAHVADKYIREGGREEVVGSEIFLTGKLKNIFLAKVTSAAKMIADGNKRYLNFDVLNDSILAGSRAPYLKGSILISEMNKDGELISYWENIYK